MTQEEKEILLKDLCTRLPYGVKFALGANTYTAKGIDLIVTDEGNWEYAITTKHSKPIEIKYVKPFLRPMSSMTVEEKKEFETLGWRIDELDNNTPWIHNSYNVFDGVDWLNKKMFDYCGLIPMSLALESPEGMYNIKSK